MFKQFGFPSLGVLSVLTATVVATGSALVNPQPGLAQTTKYFCDTSGRTPTTVARTNRGVVTIVRWNATLGGGAYDPATRCQQVSARFQNLHENRMLRFITTGRQNGQNIICVAAERNGACLPNGLLFTVRPGNNPRTVLQQMVNISRLASSGPIYESSQPRLYVDMEEILAGNGDETPAPTTP